MHTNLFVHGHSREEVKSAMEEHQRRDSRTLRLIDLSLGGTLLVLVRDMEPLDAIALFVAALCGLSGLQYFVDQSVRNFYLHRLDWEQASE